MPPSPIHRVARAAAALGLSTLAGLGCISPRSVEQLPTMCEQPTDCDQAAGEVCDEGVCWGDPPVETLFAAVLVPPPERSDLPIVMVPSLSISPMGDVTGLQFPEAVEVRGRVVLACPDEVAAPYRCGNESSVGAQILIERAPEFPGGPATSRTVVAVAGMGPEQDAFSFLLPRDPEAEYLITIQPDDTVGGKSIAPGEIAPPRQVLLRADSDHQVHWTIGTPSELKSIRGCVQNVLGEGQPYAGMKVVAFGRWTQLSPLERASSRSFVGDDGCFELSVPRDMLDQFTITVQPPAGVPLPTLTLRDEFVRDPADGEQMAHVIDPPLVMPIAPVPTTFRLPIVAQSSAGGQEPVTGADVRLTTTFTPPALNLDRKIEITYVAEAVSGAIETDEPGVAVLELYPGDELNRSYLVTVVAPTGSPFGSLYEHEVTVGIGGAQVLQQLALERRTAVTGIVRRTGGDLVADAPIEARPAARFRQRLDQDALDQAVAELPLPTTSTDATGGFLLWLDRQLVGQEASYDIDVMPLLYSGAPSWTLNDVAMPESGDALDLMEIVLPEASYARAVVRDQANEVVPGAELHLYQLPPDDYCLEDDLEPGQCDPPAKLRGVWLSDEEGMIRVVLPDP